MEKIPPNEGTKIKSLSTIQESDNIIGRCKLGGRLIPKYYKIGDMNIKLLYLDTLKPYSLCLYADKTHLDAYIATNDSKLIEETKQTFHLITHSRRKHPDSADGAIFTIMFMGIGIISSLLNGPIYLLFSVLGSIITILGIWYLRKSVRERWGDMIYEAITYLSDRSIIS
jgi:hypothetical protein